MKVGARSFVYLLAAFVLFGAHARADEVLYFGNELAVQTLDVTTGDVAYLVENPGPELAFGPGRTALRRRPRRSARGYQPFDGRDPNELRDGS